MVDADRPRAFLWAKGDVYLLKGPATMVENVALVGRADPQHIAADKKLKATNARILVDSGPTQRASHPGLLPPDFAETEPRFYETRRRRLSAARWVDGRVKGVLKTLKGPIVIEHIDHRLGVPSDLV